MTAANRSKSEGREPPLAPFEPPASTPRIRDRTAIATYLHYGYLPRTEPRAREMPWARVRALDVPPVDWARRPELLERGVEAFRSACQVPADELHGDVSHVDALHVVPLSGGVDSRLILATLLEAGLRERVVAATFGIPGTFDFDIAPLVARAAGVPHEVFDLRRFPMKREDLLASARRAPSSYVFEVFYNHLPFRRFGRSAAYWSGSQANMFAGQDLDVHCADWPSACRRFAAETRIARSVDLAPPGFRPEAVLPDRPPAPECALTLYEQIYVFVRDPCRNEPGQLPPDFDVRAPFRRAEWVDFILRVPAEIREGGGFYFGIAARASPALFALPVKNQLGFPLAAPRWRVQLRRARLKAERFLAARCAPVFRHTNPKWNYANFDEELRAPSPLAEIVEDSLQRLVRSGAVDWLAPLELWHRHARRRANHSDALMVLASLELCLAANEG